MSTRASNTDPHGAPAEPGPGRATSAVDATFLRTLESWFDSRPEILVLIRYHAAAGDKDFEFFFSFADLASRMRHLRARTSVIAFRQPQLRLRGVVTESFVASCLSHLTDGSEFLVLEMTRRTYGGSSYFHWAAGESHAELQQALADSGAVPVAVGLYPPWLTDTEDVISAVVPDEDGVARSGIY